MRTLRARFCKTTQIHPPSNKPPVAEALDSDHEETVDCENCGEPIDPNDARKCNVYDPRHCKGTCCDGCCVDGFSFCEHCQDGYDSDHERDLYDMLAVEGETLPKGDACYGSRLRSRKTLTLIMAGGGSHWWNYVVEDDKVYIENSDGRELQEGLKLVERVLEGTSFLRLVREQYEANDDEHEVQAEEDFIPRSSLEDL